MTEQLKVKLLKYLKIGKPIRGAATHEEFQSFNSAEIKRMKNALLEVGLIEKVPGMKTSGQLYRTTTLGKKHLKDVGAGA